MFSIIFLILSFLKGFGALDLSNKDGLFYIYNWTHLVDRYARYTDRPHGVDFPDWTWNYGSGKCIQKETMEYKTSQFGLFKIMYERALLDPRRTMDPENATSFLIPYDFGMDATFFETNGRMRRTGCPLAAEALKLLNSSKYFHSNHGHDHTLIVSVNQNMNYFFHAKNCLQVFHQCWNCTKLSIDEYMFIAKDRNFELKNRGINWHAVPFPADYHFDSSIEQIPMWERKQENRSYLVSFTGSPKRYNAVSTSIRLALLEQCHNLSHICTSGNYHHHTALDLVKNLYEKQHSVFCLQPPGDMPTRKSVFDTILSGCIPVFFNPLTARLMYEWHLGQSGWEEIGFNFDSVSEAEAIIEQRLNVVKALMKIAEEQPQLILEKRQKIRELAYQLQYSLINFDNSTNRSTVSQKTIDGKKLLDAYDISMKWLLDIHSGRKTHDRISSYAECAQIHGAKNQMLQTAEWCNISTLRDPFHPPSVVSYLYQWEKKKTA